MTSSEKWICDGTPKNGKNYSPHGWEHEPHENYSTDCEICGLPKESVGLKPTTPPIPIKPILIAIVGVIVLAGGGTAFTFMAKGCEAGLEKIDGECIDPFLQPYQEAKQLGEEAISIAANYQSIEDLTKAEAMIENSLSHLSQIPLEALVYPEVEIELAAYKQKKVEINSNLIKEKTALDNLKEAEIIASNAKLETEGDRSTSQLNSAKAKWKNAQNKLKEINSDTLIISQAEQYLSDYDLQIKNIDSRIAAMARRNRPAPTTRITRTPTQPARQSTFVRRNPVTTRTQPKSIPSDSCAVNKSPNCLF